MGMEHTSPPRASRVDLHHPSSARHGKRQRHDGNAGGSISAHVDRDDGRDDVSRGRALAAMVLNIGIETENAEIRNSYTDF